MATAVHDAAEDEPALAPLSCPELVRILRALVLPPPVRDREHVLHWTAWRRWHQAVANRLPPATTPPSRPTVIKNYSCRASRVPDHLPGQQETCVGWLHPEFFVFRPLRSLRDGMISVTAPLPDLGGSTPGSGDVRGSVTFGGHMRPAAYARLLVVAGRLGRRRLRADREKLATPGIRRIAALIDAAVERGAGLPDALRSDLLELDGFLGGATKADAEDSGNAGASYVLSILIRTTKQPLQPDMVPDRHLAILYELLGREYVRFADWATAAECFAGAALYWRTARHKRRTFCQSVVLSMKAGDRDSALANLEIIEGASHGASAVFHQIAARVLDETPGIGAHEVVGIEQVRKLGIIPYTYLVSCLAERLAADAQPERALGLLASAIARLAGEGADYWLVGELEQRSATIWVAMGRHEEGLGLALAAWGKLDAPRYRACSHAQRVALWANFGPSRRAALTSVIALGDGRAVAELIESCRLQSMIGTIIEVDTEDENKKLADSGVSTPSELADATENSRPFISKAIFTALNDAFGATLLRFPSPVSFQGVALLMPHYGSVLPTKSAHTLAPRSLDEALPEGLFWSSHIEDGFLFWFAAQDGKPIGYGKEDLRQQNRVKPVLLGLAGQSQSSEPKSWSLFPYKRGPGDYYEPYTHLESWKSAEEQIITRTIGDLLPPPLVAELSAATAADPVQLTISAARELASVPWPIVMIPGGEERLVERAALRMWTSTPTQLTRSARRGRPDSSPAPFLLACDNPDGTLRERTSESVVRSAATLLEAAGSPAPATKKALLQALHQIGPSTRGLFFYRGHAVHDSDPAWSALPLAGDDYLSSGELFGCLDDGTPFLPVPERVVLSCCSSSTASSLGGEAIGLAAGAIQSGADQVIATSVDILDTSFTEVFEDLIVEEMLARPQDNHVDLLRRLQLRMLNEWKICSLRGTTDSGDDVRDPHPVIWASYQAY
ncbi:CHAT domain-containing protein [Streptomyces sp. NPDC058632]|uniref:CHAT domain-containing protein n=1 Tax=Streptomyces sp. NPDC058632 TaxID=3346567 RepID=UPI003660F2EA